MHLITNKYGINLYFTINKLSLLFKYNMYSQIINGNICITVQHPFQGMDVAHETIKAMNCVIRYVVEIEKGALTW